jgi:hypothetical protein
MQEGGELGDGSTDLREQQSSHPLVVVLSADQCSTVVNYLDCEKFGFGKDWCYQCS